MDDKESARAARRRLKTLLEANHYVTERCGEFGYAIPFVGRFRDWHVRVQISNGWLALTTLRYGLA